MHTATVRPIFLSSHACTLFSTRVFPRRCDEFPHETHDCTMSDNLYVVWKLASFSMLAVGGEASESPHGGDYGGYVQLRIGGEGVVSDDGGIVHWTAG